MRDFKKDPNTGKNKGGAKPGPGFAILDAILSLPEKSIDLMGAFLAAGYGASWKHMESMAYDAGAEARVWERVRQEELLKFRKLKSRLLRDGLIAEIKKEGNVTFKATKAGRDKHADWKQRHLFLKKYPIQKIKDFIIVIFDIPEKQRKKRAWLRSALRRLEFEMVQQSVWVGNTKIPEELLSDLHDQRLTGDVEIFVAQKLGSLSAED